MALASAPPRPIDSALLALERGQPERALSHLVPVLRMHRDPAALLLAGRALASLEVAEAPEVLGEAVAAAQAARTFGVAVVACRTLEELGEDVSPRWDGIAELFGREESAPVAAAPPDLSRDSLSPERSDSASLIEEVIALARTGEARPVQRQEPAVRELLVRLGPSGLRDFVEALHTRVVLKDEVLIEEGSPGDAAFLLARGELEVRRRKDDGSDGVLARLGAGSLFGEMALLSRSPRTASVIAVRPSLILRAERAVLDALAERNPSLGGVLARHCRRRMVENLVQTSAILRSIPAAERRKLLESFVARTFDTGDRVILRGSEGAGLHLVASGALRVVSGDGEEATQVARLGVGEVVGEIAMVLRRPADADVIADCPTVTLQLASEKFLAIVKQHPKLFARLYELAVERQEETKSLLAERAELVAESDLDEAVLF